MKLLLVSANTSRLPYPVYPLGLDYVASAVLPRHQSRIVDMNELGSMEKLIEVIRDFSPDLVGLSLRNVDNSDTIETRSYIEKHRGIAEAIRRGSASPLVLGGSGFTIFPIEFLEALGADYGIVGEGERLGAFLDALERGDDVRNLPGVVARGSDSYTLEPLDEPFHREFDPGNSHIGYYLKRGGMLNLQSKRGCSFHCIYCTYPRIEGRRLRPIPPEEVASTARALQDAGAKYLFITDSAFNCSYEHSLQVAMAFAGAGVSIPWGAFFAPTPPPADYFRALADSGLTHVEFGTESLSDSMLASYRKPFNAKGAMAAHESALEAGLHVAHYLLLGGPGEDGRSLAETLDRAEDLKKTVLFFFCGIRIYPHTELYGIALREGKISADQNLLEPVFYQADGISAAEIYSRVEERARGRGNWIIGSGGEKTSRVLSRMYSRGHTGPLWEHLIS